MQRVAILASDNMIPGASNQRDDSFERDEELGKLVPACANLGIAVELMPWRTAGAAAIDFDAMLPLFVWDYFEGNEDAFLKQMVLADQQTLVLNPVKLLMWNQHKRYLKELSEKGVSVIPTHFVTEVTSECVEQAFAEFKTEQLVIKPQVGGGAWRQVLQHRDQPLASADQLPPEDAMIQGFLPSILTEGEYSFVYFDGTFSHGLIKRPKSGDYRIQSIYGGTEETYTPTKDEQAIADSVLAALDETPLYARVDLLRGLDGQLQLIELELIEPYLYMPHASGDGGENAAARTLAKALQDRLTSTQ